MNVDFTKLKDQIYYFIYDKQNIAIYDSFVRSLTQLRFIVIFDVINSTN